MKALGVAFSARKRGNCLSCIEYVLGRLKEEGLETEIINLHDYEIKPCSHCNYECFAHILRGKEEECPVQDDVPKIYRELREADVVILAIPTYCGKPAALYSAFTERAQSVFKDYEEFKNTILTKTVALIVIGNVPAGGDVTYHSVILDYYDCKNPPLSILLQSTEYGRGSLYGDLLEDEKVKDRLDNLVKLILKNLKNKR